jgi:hypothetical protein
MLYVWFTMPNRFERPSCGSVRLLADVQHKQFVRTPDPGRCPSSDADRLIGIKK